MNVEVDEYDQDDIGARYRMLMRSVAEGIIRQSVGDRHGDSEDIGKQDRVDWVNPEIGERREHRRRVMNAVELPEERHAMA